MASISLSSISSVGFADPGATMENELKNECNAFLGESKNDPNSLLNMELKKIYGTNCVELSLSPEEKQKRLKAELIQKQQKECIEIVESKCNISIDPTKDTLCMKHKVEKEIDYIIFYNRRLKLFSTVKGLTSNSCKMDRTVVWGKLEQTKVYSGNLVLISNGKPLFFDAKGEVRQLLDNSGNSFATKGAFIQGLESDDGGLTLNLLRRSSNESSDIEKIKVTEKDLMDEKRTVLVAPNQKAKAQVTLNDGKGSFTVEADLIH